MASAALNAGLLEALVVSRGATSQITGSVNPHPGSPHSTGEEPSSNHHTYLHAHFQGVTSHYTGDVDAHEISTSGGDATTEDDEGSLNDQISNYYRSVGEEHHLSASAKKRRKQSKPLRLPTPQGEAGDNREVSARKQEEAQFDSEMSNPSAEGDENITCPHCNLEAPTEDSLRRHIIEEHIGQLLNDDEARQHQQQRQQQQHMKDELEPGEQRISDGDGAPLNLSSPKWEDRPSSRHLGGFSPPTTIPMPPSFTDGKFSLPNLLPIAPPPFLLPLFHQEHERYHGGPHSQQNSSPSSSSGPQNRIFNQEAYCELCHKEFCNKYFLKTHKANKHGIYSPEISSSPTGIPSGHSTPLGSTVPLTSPLGPNLNTGNLAGSFSVGSPYAGAFITANMNTLPLRPLLPTQHSANKLLSGNNKDSSTSNNKSSGVINLEAYCELCQKEFCNKYFLKRHKAKIHGISIDVTIKPKNQIQPRVAPDRPEGWCDACRRDVGGRAALNAHKLQAHGPHVVAPLPSPHNASPQAVRNPRTPTPKDVRKDFPDPRDLREYFSPWDSLKDPREVSRESWEVGRDGEVSRDLRESKDSTIRSPWDRPLGSPWDGVRELPKNDAHRESTKENSADLVNRQDPQRNDSWSNQGNQGTDHHDVHSNRGRVPPIGPITEANDFPLDTSDMQAIRQQQHPDWEIRQKSLEHQRERGHEYIKQERDRELQQREREQQQREDQQREQAHHQWERERERELVMFREHQLEIEMYERGKRERALIEHEQEAKRQADLKHMHNFDVKRENHLSDNVEHNHEKRQSEHGNQHKDNDENNSIQAEDSPEEGQIIMSKKENSTHDTPEDHIGASDVEQKFLENDERDLAVDGGGSDRHKDSRGDGCDVRSISQEGNSYENRDGPPDSREISREASREGHRTPGSSSADDNSRDTGIIARVGQPAMVQAPPGTKFTPEQLRQLGVINPDAFCELCCKEFCNKYFLRTHRIKKHGIYTPEFSDRSKAQHKDSSHLNLARLLERQAFDLRPALPDIEGDLECEICRRPFPSPYLLQMHKYYFHGPGQEAMQQEQLILHPQPSPHEQLRQLALHAQQQARQEHHQQQQHKARMHEQQRRLQEHQEKLQQQREEEQKEQIQFEHNKKLNETTSEEGELDRTEEMPRPSVIESAGSGESDASEDLRKLQSMILQLNRQGEMSLRCRLCNKDVGNKYFLRAHMMTEHGILGNEDVTVSAPASEGAQTPKTPCEPNPKSSSPTTPSGENQGFCNVCKKDFFSRYILQQHMLSAHGVFTPPAPPASFMERIRAEVESREDRKPQSTSRSYCEICNKELCNKYFMKTHMLKMHGINLENGVSGGVTCDLCNKELCSKYFLRVHKQNTHGLVEEGREEGEGVDKSEIESCPLCPRLFKNRKWLKTHLTSDHDDTGKEKWREIEASMLPREPIPKRGPPCSICGQFLPDLVSLQLHVIKAHGTHESIMDSTQRTSLAEEVKTNSLQCSLCPFTAPTPALLFAHARTHAQGLPSLPGVLAQTVPCPLCTQVLPNLEAYQHHLLQHQLQGLLKPLFEKEVLPTESNTSEPYDPPINNAEFVEEQTQPRRHKKRWRCSQCSRKFRSRVLCLTHVHAMHNPRARGTWLGRPAIHRRLFKCRKCGAVARRLAALRQHIREQHRAGPSLPTSHATPTKPKTAGRFVMQPFLLNNEGREDGERDEGRNEKHTLSGCQFVPSLVYLPVARRVQHPLTVSFSLTPA